MSDNANTLATHMCQRALREITGNSFSFLKKYIYFIFILFFKL